MQNQEKLKTFINLEKIQNEQVELKKLYKKFNQLLEQTKLIRVEIDIQEDSVLEAVNVKHFQITK